MVTLTFTKTEEIDDWIVNNIVQNDARYDIDPAGRQILSFFILNNGIIIKEKIIPQIKKPSDKDLMDIQKPQEIDKYIAIKLLEKKKIHKEQIRVEYPFYDRRVDVYAKNGEKQILIECGPCSFQKVLEYTEEPNTEMWLLTMGASPWETVLIKYGKMQWFIFKKGPNWKKCYKKYQEFLDEKMEKIRKHIDKLEQV